MFKGMAIKKYFNKMYPFLLKGYGKEKYYTKGQVLNTVRTCEFKEKYAIYALTIFMEKSEFEQLSEFTCEEIAQARQEIADRFFDGNTEYTFEHIAGVQYRGGEGHCSISVGGGGGGGGD